MKILFPVFFLFLSALAMAHVEPTDSIAILPKNSKFLFKRDFNVKPKLQNQKLGSDGKVTCYLNLGEKGISDDDRVIKAGTFFLLTFVDMDYPRFKTNNDRVETIYCENPKEKNRSLTIQEFEDAVTDVAELIMPEPTEF